jgi:hypothetical protein
MYQSTSCKVGNMSTKPCPPPALISIEWPQFQEPFDILYRGIITDDPDFDVYRMKEGKLNAIASSYFSKQFSSNDKEG